MTSTTSPTTHGEHTDTPDDPSRRNQEPVVEHAVDGDQRGGRMRDGHRDVHGPDQDHGSEPHPDPVLAHWLDAELDLEPLAQRGFVNHLAMELVAARRLGASDDELAELHLAGRDPSFVIERDRPDWLGPLTAEIVDRGVEVVTAERLPGLVDAPSSQFFHAIIRLELALDAGHPAQVANALGNWASDARPLGPLPSPSGQAELGEVLDALAAELAAGGTDAPNLRDLADSDLRALAEATSVRRTLDSLAPLGADELLDQVSAFVVSLHSEVGDFGTLHLVTGTRAAVAVATVADDATRRRLALRTAQAAAVMWMGFGAPAPASPEDLDARRATATATDWDAIARAAVDTRDAHVVKLAYACRLEHARTGDPLYRWVAARGAGIAV